MPQKSASTTVKNATKVSELNSICERAGHAARDFSTKRRKPSKQIGPILARASLRLLFPPRCDLRMITRQQHVRNSPAAKIGRARVLRRFEQSATERIIGGGLFVTENARREPDDRIDYDNGRDRAIGQDVIADRQFKIDQMFNHAMVDAFVMSADDDEVRFLR